MEKTNPGKYRIIRQVRIYHNIQTTKYHGPKELQRRFHISKRMIQRDLKDLRESGMIRLRYDRKTDNYVPDKKEAVFDGTASGRRLEHLKKLRRLCVLLFELTPVDPDALSDYLWAPEYYEKPDIPDLRAEYFSLFPECSDRTRQRDFRTLTEAGFPIRYDRKWKAYLYEYPSV